LKDGGGLRIRRMLGDLPGIRDGPFISLTHDPAITALGAQPRRKPLPIHRRPRKFQRSGVIAFSILPHCAC
jgi:hypothetical protein